MPLVRSLALCLALGLLAACGGGGGSTPDTTPPGAPALSSTSPTSPSSSATPALVGTAEAGSTVRIYAQAGCAGPVAASGTASGTGTFSIQAPAAANATTVFSATATDAAGNVSPCSASLSYVSDSIPPADPVLAAVVPPGPANGVHPQVSGTGDPGSRVVLHPDAACAGPSLGQATVAGDGTFQATATVPANATTTFHAVALDAAGNLSACVAGPSYAEDSLAPAAPVLISSSPPSPARSTAPVLSGTAEPGATVQVFAQAACGGTPVANAVADAGGAFSAPVAASANAQTVYTATATDAAGNVSACSAPLAYLNDTLPPADPIFLGVLPASPSNVQTPVVSGTAEAGATVLVYADPGCAGAVIGNTVAGAGASFAVQVLVPANQVTAFGATATDAAGNSSGCAPGPTYLHDGIAPAQPALLAAVPASPSKATSLVLSGTAEPGSRVSLFDAGTCGGPVLAFVTAAADGTFGVPVSTAQGVLRNQANPFTVNATDIAGNVSLCSAPLTWVQDDTPPVQPAVLASSPASPSQSTTPTLSGTAEAGSTVTVYGQAACGGSAVATVTAAVGDAFSVQVTVGANSTSNFTITATDAAGNTSSCSQPLRYVADDTPPPAPVFSGVAPPVTGNTRTPIVSGTAEAASAVKVYGDSLCKGTMLGSGAATGGSFAVTATVPANQATSFYATATDAAGNVSPCAAGPSYVENEIPPAAPVLSAPIPPSPSKASSVQIVGSETLAPVDGSLTLSLHDSISGKTCTGSPIATQAAFPGGGFVFPVTQGQFTANAANTFSVQATDAAGNSTCSAGLTWIHDDVAPLAPAIASSNPVSPAKGAGSAFPVLSGTAEAGATVTVYALAACAGPSVATTTATGGTFTTSAITVPLNQTTTFTATAADAAGNVSGCSASFPYTSDTIAPAPPVFTGTSPASGPPTSSSTPTVSGTAEPSSTVRIYRDPLCQSASPVATAAAGTGVFSAKVAVPLNASTTFGATATDAAGNTSACAAATTPYLEDSTPPTFGGLVSATGVDAITGGVANAVQLTWNAATDAVTSAAQVTYGICYADAYDACATSFTALATVTGTTTATVQLAAPGTRKFFLVRASDQAGNYDANTVRLTAKSFGDGVVATASGGGPLAIPPAAVTPPFSCVLDGAGRVECQGDNTFGQLGNGGRGGAVMPIPPALAVTAGEQHACALVADGGVYCWGRNDQGQAGVPLSNAFLPVPSQVQGVPPAIAVRAGRAHTCALIADGTVRCWGRNDQGQLGGGSTSPSSATDAAAPQVTVQASGGGSLTGVSALAAGEGHTCALLASGAIQCWGDGSLGQLGNGSASSQLSPVAFGAANGPYVAVDAGWSHTCAITGGSGRVYCAGQNADGQLGTGTAGGTSATPVHALVPGFRAIQLALGRAHSCAMDLSLFPLCWGDNSSGQVGNGLQPTDAATPTPVPVPVAGAGLFAGNDATCHVENGQVACWGNLPQGGAQPQPLTLGLQEADHVVALAAGQAHTCALLADGTLRCFGAGSQGQLGQGAFLDAWLPGDVAGLQFRAVAAGGGDTCASGSDGAGTTCWGGAGYAQLGQSAGGVPDTTPSDIPGLYVTGIDFPLGIGDHGCALDDSSGDVRCWGRNDSGELGRPPSGPGGVDLVAGPTIARAVTVGAAHSCAIDRQGNVWCWGDDSLGQLGDGGASDHHPRTVPFVVNAVELRAAGSTTCARGGDGTVACWGANDAGQAGTGTPGATAAPGPVLGLSQAIGLAVGPAHACAVRADGTVWCWGSNASGQLGDGSGVSQPKPVQAQGIAGAKQVVVGDTHSCALRADGLALCWGGNANGQLGDGTTVSRPVPVLVEGVP